MLSRMKPVPRFILIVAVIGGAVYGASKFGALDRLKKPDAEPTAVTAPEQAPAPVQAAAPAPAPAPAADPVPSSNAGLDAVLKQGARK